MLDTRNLVIAAALSFLLIVGWDYGMRYFYPEASISAAVSPEGDAPAASAVEGAAAGDLASASPGGAVDAAAPGTDAMSGPVDLSAALASETRVAIDAPRIAGSINLVGARIDDIVLKDHRETVDNNSGPVRLFAPDRTEAQHFAEFGFVTGNGKLPANTLWQASGERLTPETPVTLTHQAGDLTYRIELSIDDNYMITARQSVANTGSDGAIVQPFALLKRTDRTATADEFLVHSGPVGVFGGTLFDGNNYEELTELGRDTPAGNPAWLGFTDRYWLSALIPSEGAGDVNRAGFYSLGNNLFSTELRYDAQPVPAGQTISQQSRLFVGAKESELLDAYADNLGIENFGLAISWGWFQILEKPLLWLLRNLNALVGNFGVAIILMTVVIRGLLFPIAQKQFSSMAQMKAVQPKMKAIQERYKDDKQKQQQEIMKLYKDEKVNPLAGCLPLLVQIPIFFALYKVLILAIDMRHEPFALWIVDLSAPDPAHILNLFGLLPYEVVGFLAIGPLAILLGVTMWLTFRLNPSAMDPMQQQIFNIMPWILMFVMAPFAAGLLLYWVTSNLLTLAQQSYLYSRHPQLRAQAEKDKQEMARKKAGEDKDTKKGKA
ncbi:membrane protein insertase YidC [Erythrobacter litoralis]|uniref:Membrane protein insertase YidC n=1 Tax=Erythrobacter litoralis TaxID=39960 RepID=A0A074MK90_9SPHN|nr:membrane protein insertase YidC [Erythrobacter litoralis]KEO92283.1 membrane protein insertase YidC [Erythrobacter litoralis]MEE4338925.1 membrane protein insertase YidC [Erythrobacter sp.]